MTLQDLADKAGCSRNTASLAMRNSTRISETLRGRIQSLASQMGYVPNLSARNLSARRSGLIGLYARALEDAVRSALAEALLVELHTEDYRPMLGVGQGQASRWRDAPWMQTFQAMGVEAMVTVGEEAGGFPQWARSLPRVLVGNHPSGKLRCDSVALDRVEGARLGIEHLVSHGHRRVLVACEGSHAFSAGCISALAEAGLTPMMLPGNDGEGSLNDRAIASLTSGRWKPTAVIFGDSPEAVRFLRALGETSLRCPRDLAVVGYDFFPWADDLAVPLTTIDQPIDELARQAGQIVHHRLSSDDQSPPQQFILPHRLIVRASS